AVDLPEIGHFGDVPKFVRADLPEWRVHRHHGIINPDIDWAEGALDRFGGRFYLVALADIGGDSDRASAQFLYFALSGIQSIAPARQQADTAPFAGQHADHGPPYAAGCAGNYDDFSINAIR